MSQGTDLYFDHPYEPDPMERGLYWATRFTDTRKTFGFLPDSLYDNIDVERSGKPLTKEDVCEADFSKCDTLEKKENIIGESNDLYGKCVDFSCLSIYLSIYLSICLSVYLSIYLSIYL